MPCSYCAPFLLLPLAEVPSNPMVFAGVCVILLVFWTLLCELWTVTLHLSLQLPLTESFFPWLSRQWLMEGIAALTCLASIGVIVSAWRRGVFPSVSWWKAWWLWILWAGVSVLYSIDRGLSLRSWLAFASYGMLAYVLCALIETPDDLQLWMRFLVGAAVTVSLQGISQYLVTFKGSLALMEQLQRSGTLESLGWGGDIIKDFFLRKRIFSVFGWPNLFAGFLLLTIPLAVSLTMSSQTRYGRIGWAIASGLLGVCLILTLSLGAWLAAILAGSIAWWLIQHSQSEQTALAKTHRSFAWTLGAGLLICGLVAVTCFIVAKRARPVILGSTNSRLVYLQGALNIMRARPFLGTGLGTFGIAYRSLMPQEPIEGQHAALHAHNTLLQFGAELGLIGLCCFLMFLWRVWQVMVRSTQEQSSRALRVLRGGLVVGLLGFFTHSVLEQTFFEAATAPFWWMVLGILSGGCSVSSSTRRAVTTKPDPSRPLLGLAVLTGCGLVITWQLTLADVWAANGMWLDLANRPHEALAVFEQAGLWDPLESRYPIEEGERSLRRTQGQSRSNASLILKQVQQQFERAVTLSPWLGYVWLRLGMTSWQLGQFDRAMAEVRHAMKQDPNLRAAPANLMQMLLASGRFEEVTAVAQHFQHLEPAHPMGYFCEALAWERLGQTAQAVAAYRRAVEYQPTHFASWFNLAELFRAQGALEEAGHAYKAFLRTAPTGDSVRRDRAQAFIHEPRSHGLLQRQSSSEAR